MRRRVTPLLSILVLVFSIGVYAPGAYAEVLGDGSLDPSFDPGTGLASTLPPTAGLAIAEQTDGKILIGGYFTSYNGADRSGIVRVNPDGSVDQTFNPGTGLNGPPVAIVPQADGKILVAGSFTEFDGVARGNLLRLNSDGSLDTTYVPAGFNDQVSAMAMLADGDLLIAGPFVFYGATATPAGLVRLNPDTTMDTNFNPATGTAGAVRSILERPDGGVLLGGEFANYGAAARAGIVRIEGNGSLVPSFDPGAGFTGGFQPGLLSLASTDGGVIAAGA
ncbi:delta-60 repeat domain-containing protein, partial [Candidatus Nanopelagicales bacterium]|nr:delta-60 repeat domain-containing protein [Candidatus Nanopelagicales bacterium]